MLYGELPGLNCNLTRIITIKVRFQAINQFYGTAFLEQPSPKNTRHMTSPLGHHTIGHTIIIFCTNDRLWLGVGPVFRQTLNCTNIVQTVYDHTTRKCFFREQQCISSMWFSKFQSTALPGMLWLHKHGPKSPSIKWLWLPEGLLRPAFSLFCRSVWKSTAGIRTCKTRERNLCSWMASGSRKMFEVLWTWTCQFFPVGNVGTRFEGIDLLPEIFSAACASLVDRRFLF